MRIKHFISRKTSLPSYLSSDQEIQTKPAVSTSKASLRAGLFRKRTKRSYENNLAGYIFISPWLIGFLLLTLWPIAQSFYLSFTQYSLLNDPTWIGVNNYSEIFLKDQVFRKSMVVTFTYVLFSVPLKLFFSLMIAILLNKSLKGMNLYRTAIYFPSLIGTSVAVAVLWRNMFSLDGYINHVLGWFGIHGVGWIANPHTSLWTLILLNTWQFGSTMIIFLAGLKQIPQDLYESASVDGAGRFGKFIHITLPMLSPVMFFNLVLEIIGSFQMFTQAFIITEGGPINSTYMYALYLFEKAFKYYQMGYASALAWILLAIIAILTGINFFVSRYWVFYESDGRGSK
ncbi:multiple sugar transport system permease protein [Pullulanibacillus pueri]|uniref:Sugar ABC transporter permease n=1 Tax=Pullulanibacillus pueri TaxID=1437324 RepID=A0A8J2ZTC5_9BACL|nr:sugar ABC transporter permease [Pullulanibacillus pueri]MBM7681815.1 multiple sugar transport system permease protein [Pullulanibacillus pueri]GGH76196.1 sugar ABC transporter permease [Pullulanibacillus pueri]